MTVNKRNRQWIHSVLSYSGERVFTNPNLKKIRVWGSPPPPEFSLWLARRDSKIRDSKYWPIRRRRIEKLRGRRRTPQSDFFESWICKNHLPWIGEYSQTQKRASHFNVKWMTPFYSRLFCNLCEGKYCVGTINDSHYHIVRFQNWHQIHFF